MSDELPFLGVDKPGPQRYHNSDTCTSECCYFGPFHQCFIGTLRHETTRQCLFIVMYTSPIHRSCRTDGKYYIIPLLSSHHSRSSSSVPWQFPIGHFFSDIFPIVYGGCQRVPGTEKPLEISVKTVRKFGKNFTFSHYHLWWKAKV